MNTCLIYVDFDTCRLSCDHILIFKEEDTCKDFILTYFKCEFSLWLEL